MKYDSELKFAIETAFGSGVILKDYFGKIEPGQPRDSVKGILSEADLKSDEYIRAAIESAYPEFGILSEESSPKEGDEYTWVVDPLDGTTNFTYGVPDFVVLIALAKNNQPVVGVGYNPASGELFHAVKGGGAFYNNNQVKVSKRNLQNSMVVLSTDWLYAPQKTTGLKLLKELTEEIEPNRQRVFRLRLAEGGNRLGYVAKGAYDAFMIDQTKPWDIAAGALMIEEAGGKVTNHEGKVWDIYTKDLLMSNGIIHTDLLKILGDIKK